MGLIEKLLNKFISKKQTLGSEIITSGNVSFFAKGNVFDSEIFMSAVYAHARQFSKITPRHYLKNDLKDSHLTRLLSLRPNPLMSASTFWEKFAIEYYTVNNVFIYIERDNFLNERALWILDPAQTSTYVINENVYLKFSLNGKELISSIDDVLHIPRNINLNDFFGAGNDVISRTLKLIETNHIGIENAIKSSAFIRFLVKTSTPLDEKERKRRVKQFANDYLDPSNSVGVGYLDNATDVVKLDSQAKYANHDEMLIFEDKINKYLGISDKIIRSDFSEDEWQSYYQSTLLPAVKKICDEATYKFFTPQKLSHGNSIKIEVDEMNYASLKNRIQIIAQSKDIGILTINEQRNLLGLPPIEGGEQIRQVSLNYVQADKQNEYQEVEKEELTDDRND